MLEHGGNLNLAAKQYGIPRENWLDLSTGINPNGYPIPDIPASAWQRLPADDDELIEAACAYYGCKFAVPTAGSQAALQLLPTLRPACKVAMLSPMYQEHTHAWQRHGHQVHYFSNLTDQVLIDADVVLLCNPNNPSAKSFPPSELLSLHHKLSARNGWLIVDEAFIDATPEQSIATYSHLKGLFVLRSLGKFFGLAGARVGFLLGAEQVLMQAQNIIGPWSLTGPSRFVAQQALMDAVWQQQTRLALLASSARLAALLERYSLSPNAGTALFQFTPNNQAIEWRDYLAKKGILVRLFHANAELGQQSALRFGLPSENGWEHLENALKEAPIKD
ncbi:MAG: threonine-phosphate decarboxylase CobD [Methylotenera sp.]|nr:threonine-phosphate decarboxylase [Methylotenera sp.]